MKISLKDCKDWKRKNFLCMNIDKFGDGVFDFIHDEYEMNVCDKCGEIHDTDCLSWIDAEDFKPLEKDKFNPIKYQEAIEIFGFSALCEDCYKKECCGDLNGIR